MPDDTLIGGEEPTPTPNLLDDVDNEPTSPDTPTPDDSDSPGDDKVEGEPWEASDIGSPEGFEEIDSSALEVFVPLAKQLNLSKDQAQQLVNVHADLMYKAGEYLENETDTMYKEWANESMKDTEIGGAKLQQNVAFAKTALDTFGNTELKDILKVSGLGNNVEVIRMFAKIGEAVSNDRFIQGKSTDDQPKSHADILFPNMG